MTEETGKTGTADAQAIHQQLEKLLLDWIDISLSETRRKDLVEEVLREHREAISIDLEALTRRIRAEIETEARHREKQLQEEQEKKEEKGETGKEFVRFSLNMRIQHILLLSSCIVLILTGLPIKFHDTAWGVFMFDLMGGIQNSAMLHRIGAVGLIAVGLYHALYTVAFAEGRKNFFKLIPGPKDAKDLLQMLKYFVGSTDEKPKFDRFSYVEKFDYWAVYWGIIIMVGSGLFLWFTEMVLRVFPKYVLDIAKEAHSDEALLATLAIIIWHFYNVHFNPHKFPMNKVWLTGKLSEEEMIEEHPLEYEEILREDERQRRESR